MANILHQYEEASQMHLSSNIPKRSFAEMKLEDEVPMFSKKRVNFSPTDKITHLCVSNDLIIIAMANNILLRINLRQPDHPEEIELSKHSTSLHLAHIYLDYTGNHALLCLASPNLEISSELNKLRGHEVTAVGWNHSHNSKSSSTTGPILLGTSKGVIIETEIVSEGDSFFQAGGEEYWKQVFDIGKGSNNPITCIHLHKVPNTDKYYILVTTASRLYQFRGYGGCEKPVLQNIFKTYLTGPEKFQSVDSLLPYSKLDVFYPRAQEESKRFGWLTNNGIYHGVIDPLGEIEIDLNKCELLKFPPQDSPPLTFVLTEFHVLLLYQDHVKGVCLLDQQLVFEDFYTEVCIKVILLDDARVKQACLYLQTYGKLGSITREPTKGTIWAFTERNVFSYKVIQEDRNVWQIYAERGEFDQAKLYCRDNALYLDEVTLRQAEALFLAGKYNASTEHYAKTMSISFEEVALKFLKVSAIIPLRNFLNLKLRNLKKEETTQRTMVVIWLMELYLGEMGVLRDRGEGATEEARQLELQFNAFMALPEVTDCVRNNTGTVYDLMATHGDKRNLMELAIAHHDYEIVIRHHIYKDNYMEALNVLKKTGPRQKDLYYEFAPMLIQKIPQELLDAVMRQDKQLNPAKLLPALLMCNDKMSNGIEAIKYLEHCVYKQHCTEQAVHNYLLSLYAKFTPAKVKDYLAAQGQDASSVSYDVHHALRLCQDKNLIEACVQLSTLLGLWESAIDQALTVSVDLAITTANLQQSDTQIMKRLWLKIAEHVVTEKHDVKSAMEFLKTCDLLKIEDILPFFSDFVTIDDFKEAICTSLKEYNDHIQYLKEEMDEATKSAEIIVQQVSAFKNRYSVMTANDNCALCELQLLLRPFYLFPCGHLYHSDCLTTEMLPLLTPEARTKLFDLQKQLTSVAAGGADNLSTASTSLSAKDVIKSDIDNIVAADCYFCGDDMVESVDKPFILDSEYIRIMKDWE